jgi:hypothetical protein
MTTKLAFGLGDPALQRTLEAFEHDMELLIRRTLDPNDRNAVLALRDSWHKVVEVAFGPIRRVRSCPSCYRSQLQTGPRCGFCWHRFKTADVVDDNQLPSSGARAAA